MKCPKCKVNTEKISGYVRVKVDDVLVEMPSKNLGTCPECGFTYANVEVYVWGYGLHCGAHSYIILQSQSKKGKK